MYNMGMEIVIIAHNIRSTHNIGAILRTADGFGVSKVYCTGYTPYPTQNNDARLPHLRQKITEHIHKTALGAELTVASQHNQDIFTLIAKLKSEGFTIVGLEQDSRSVMLPAFNAPQKVALLIGEEVAGITTELRDHCDQLVEIPMQGKKESFNVSVATGITLYELRRAQYNKT